MMMEAPEGARCNVRHAHGSAVRVHRFPLHPTRPMFMRRVGISLRFLRPTWKRPRLDLLTPWKTRPATDPHPELMVLQCVIGLRRFIALRIAAKQFFLKNFRLSALCGP
jgi:hypothetical protein